MMQLMESCPEDIIASNKALFISQNLSCDRNNLDQNELICDTFYKKSVLTRPHGTTQFLGSNCIRVWLIDVNVNIDNLLLDSPAAPANYVLY